MKTKDKTCHAPDAAATRASLNSAGTKLRDAINNLQSPPEPAPGEDAKDPIRDLMKDVVVGIAGTYKAVEKAKAACTPQPYAEFEFSTKIPFDPPGMPPIGPVDPATVPSVGGTFTFRF